LELEKTYVLLLGNCILCVYLPAVYEVNLSKNTKRVLGIYIDAEKNYLRRLLLACRLKKK